MTLASSSFGSGVGSGLHLEPTGGPSPAMAPALGLFLMSDDGSSVLVVDNGVLCLNGGNLGRYNAVVAGDQGLPQLNSTGLFNPMGTFQNLAGTSTTGLGFDVPTEVPWTPGGELIDPGETWYFQLWYRDLDAGASSSNFSDMLIATF